MTCDDLKGMRILVIGHVVIGRDCLSASIIPATSSVVQAMLNQLDEQEVMRKAKENRFVKEVRDYMTEPMPECRIEKKDRFSFADHFVGRGKRRNR